MKRALLLTIFLLAACTAQSTMPENTPPEFDTAAMDNLLSQSVENGDVIGVSALVFDEGETVYTGAFGLRDREREQPVEMDTVFRIYSMTKPITSAIIMDLQEEGLLSLDDPASKYIPELAQMQVMSMGEDRKPVLTLQANPMTIEDLLLHRAGIAYGIFKGANPVEDMYAESGIMDPSVDEAEKMLRLSKLPLIAQPGEGWYYSFGIDVLGRIAEVVTSQTLGDIMDERIFNPLGMNETSFAVRPDQKARFASNYFRNENGKFVLQDDGQASGFLKSHPQQSGGGGLVSTLGDYAKFAQTMLDGGIYNGHRVLSENTVKMMMTDQMHLDDKFLMPWMGSRDNNGFGYGGSVVTSDTPEQLVTTGRATGMWSWGGAARTNFWVDPENDAFGIIMLQFFGEPEPELHNTFRILTYEQTKDTE